MPGFYHREGMGSMLDYEARKELGAMHVFLSYSHADRGLAAELRRSLEAKGLLFNQPTYSPEAGTSWRHQAEKAIRSADAILLLLSPDQKADEPQQLTWRLALESVWEDPTKRWIPLLVGEARLPAFVRSGAADKDVQAVRIHDPKDLAPAVQAILQTLGIIPLKQNGEQVYVRKAYSRRDNEAYEAGYARGRGSKDAIPDPGGKIGFGVSFDGAFDVVPDSGSTKPGYAADEAFLGPDLIEVYPAVTEEDQAQWQERLSEMRKYVAQLKH
jgi:hypothetical protein